MGLFWNLRGLQYPGRMLCQTAAARIDFHPPPSPPFQFCSIKSPVCWKEHHFDVALKPGVLWRGQNVGQLLLTVTIDAGLSAMPPGVGLFLLLVGGGCHLPTPALHTCTTSQAWVLAFRRSSGPLLLSLRLPICKLG